MPDLDDFRAVLRKQLHDEDSNNYRWTDAVLDGHFERALREFGLDAPGEKKTALVTAAGSRDLSLSGLAGLVRVLAVEYPAAAWPPRYVPFSVFGTTLTMLLEGPPAGVENAYVFWGGLYTVTTGASDLPTAMEDAVIMGAAAYALLELADYMVNRVNLTGRLAERDYRTEGEARLRRFRELTGRFGESGRVLQAQLYTPADGAPSRFTASFEP